MTENEKPQAVDAGLGQFHPTRQDYDDAHKDQKPVAVDMGFGQYHPTREDFEFGKLKQRKAGPIQKIKSFFDWVIEKNDSIHIGDVGWILLCLFWWASMLLIMLMTREGFDVFTVSLNKTTLFDWAPWYYALGLLLVLGFPAYVAVWFIYRKKAKKNLLRSILYSVMFVLWYIGMFIITIWTPTILNGLLTLNMITVFDTPGLNTASFLIDAAAFLYFPVFGLYTIAYVILTVYETLKTLWDWLYPSVAR